MKAHIFTSVLLFCVSSWAWAQSQNTNFRSLTGKDGLSQSTVNCILQSKNGFIWFGTGGGLNRYDGYEFEVYKHHPDDNFTLGNNVITALHEDQKGILWVGTRSGGLAKFDPLKSRFDRLGGKSHEGDKGNIADIEEDTDGNIWVGYVQNSLQKISKNGRTTIYKNLKTKNGEPLDYNILCLKIDTKGKLWIGTLSGAFIFDPKTQEVQRFEPAQNALINFIQQAQDGKLWIGTDGEGLIEYYPENQKLIRYTRNNSGISHNGILSMYQTDTGQFWIGTRGGGLNFFDPENQTFTHYTRQPNMVGSLNSNVITALYEDNEQNIWIGTQGGGVNVLYKETTVFRNYMEEISLPDRNERDIFASNSVMSFALETDNRLWVGTDWGGLFLLDADKKVLKRYVHKPDNQNSISHNAVLCLVKDSDGFLWIGTYGGGVNRFDPKTEKFTHFINKPQDTNGISDNIIWSMTEDLDGNIWMATETHGVEMYDKKTDTFVHFPYDKQKISNASYDKIKKTVNNQSIRSIYRDSEGNIWIGSFSGANKYNYKTKQLEASYQHTPDDSTSLSNDWVFGVFEDSKKRIWIATYGGGLNLLNSDNQTFTRFTEQDGLPHGIIYGILEDQNGLLWISTHEGLSRFNPAAKTTDKRFKNFDALDGLKNTQFNRGAYIALPSGEFLLGGTNGFTAFYPSEIRINHRIPPVVLTGFRLFNKTVPILDNPELSPLQQHISLTDELVLDYDQSVLTFQFSVLNFTQSEKNQVAFRLENFEKEWNYVGNQRTATYTNLDEGTYIFRVKGANNDGIWNEEGVRLKIRIRPPWWDTIWFKFVLVIIFTVLPILWYLYRMSVIKRQKEKLEQQVRERTAEIRERNQEISEQAKVLKEAHLKLQEKSDEIVVQNEELHQQKEEIEAQRDNLLKQKFEIEQAYRNIQTLSEIGQKITATLEPERIARTVYDYVNNLMKAEDFGIGIYKTEAQVLEFSAFIERGEILPEIVEHLRQEDSLTVWAFKNIKPVIINELQKEFSNYISKPLNYKMGDMPQSMMILPLVIEHETIGVITVQSFEKNAYDERSVTILQTLASYIAIAVDNAKAYRVITQKNQNITDSIRYAQTIQHAILPPRTEFDAYFQEILLFYKPKDIVSGDFYWFAATQKYLFLVVADCTGHGVPGAFMSMIGNELLHEIIREKQIYTPSEILERLNIAVKNALRQDQKANDDGMDVGLCRFEKIDEQQTNILFAGAKRPLRVYKKGEARLQNIRGDNRSIGGIQPRKKRAFTDKEFTLQMGDIVYLTTDGFADQHGKMHGKFGTQRLKQLLFEYVHLPFRLQEALLEKELLKHQQGTEQRDDITLIAVKL